MVTAHHLLSVMADFNTSPTICLLCLECGHYSPQRSVPSSSDVGGMLSLDVRSRLSCAVPCSCAVVVCSYLHKGLYTPCCIGQTVYTAFPGLCLGLNQFLSQGVAGPEMYWDVMFGEYSS